MNLRMIVYTVSTAWDLPRGPAFSLFHISLILLFWQPHERILEGGGSGSHYTIRTVDEQGNNLAPPTLVEGRMLRIRCAVFSCTVTPCFRKEGWYVPSEREGDLQFHSRNAKVRVA
jgi:hypothetical protein